MILTINVLLVVAISCINNVATAKVLYSFFIMNTQYLWKTTPQSNVWTIPNLFQFERWATCIWIRRDTRSDWLGLSMTGSAVRHELCSSKSQGGTIKPKYNARDFICVWVMKRSLQKRMNEAGTKAFTLLSFNHKAHRVRAKGRIVYFI